jgi:hypothetical protein
MKKIMFTMLLVSASLLFTSSTMAQLNLNISIGSQPAWAPRDYANTQYYYMPDMDVYYDLPARQFIYLDHSRWRRSNSLPAAYSRYDLYKVHKVSINQKNAYLNHDRDRNQYAQYTGKFNQPEHDSRNNQYNTGSNKRQDNGYSNDNGRNRQDVVKRDIRNDNRNDNRYDKGHR